MTSTPRGSLPGQGGQPLVSVILPTFNRLQYLPAAIESVFSQTFQEWELLIADDGSGGQTRAYLKEVQQRPRVKVIWLPRMANPGAARNAALCEARGAYIAFLDSDDLWFPSKLEAQLALHSGADCEWSYTEYVSIDHAGKSIDARRNPQRVLYEGRIVEPLLQLKSGIAMPTVMVRRELLERVGGFDEHQGLHEDYDLWLRLALLAEVGVLRCPLAYVRTHAEHFSTDGIRNFQARSRVFAKLQAVVTDRRQAAVLRVARARNDTALAVANAVAGNSSAAWRALADGWRYSWRCRDWWSGCGRAVAHLVLPARLAAQLRRRRESARRRAAVRT